MARNSNASNIPQDWKYEYLDKISIRGSGHTPNKKENSYWNGNIKWVSLSDSSKLDQGLIFETDKEISDEGIFNSSAVLHPAGTVILTRDAGVGKSAILAHPMAVSQHFMAWRCDSEKLNHWFLYYWLQLMKPEFERQAVGSTIKTIGLPYFKKLKIATPPITDQIRIAELLSTWDRAISLSERALINSKYNKKGLEQQLLTGKRRMPGFKQSWKEVKLEEIFSRVTTKNNKTSKNVVTISAQYGLIKQDEFFKKTIASETLDDYFLLTKGQFAYNKSYSSGYPMGAIKRLNRYEDGVVTTLYICFEAKNENLCCPSFFEHYFEAGLLNSGLRKIANEGGRAHGLLNVKPDDFFGLAVRIPCVEEQKKIAQILSIAELEIETFQQKLSCLKVERKALMHQLFTGKIRVKVEAA
ncbi:MAG TPA: restriction endonuclease subunit S [Anaerovoracaceae bacterium]|nr:restriction endonuclease subunit S [Anaerovoracaceae bacterium]